jgi:hypothetical protein
VHSTIKPGISSILLAEQQLAGENSEVNQTLADEFPQRQNREFSPTQSGIKFAEPGIIPKYVPACASSHDNRE